MLLAQVTQVVSDPTSITWWAEHFGVFGVILFLGVPVGAKILYWFKKMAEDIKDCHIDNINKIAASNIVNTESLKTLTGANTQEVKLLDTIASVQEKHSEDLTVIRNKVNALLTH